MSIDAKSTQKDISAPHWEGLTFERSESQGHSVGLRLTLADSRLVLHEVSGRAYKIRHGSKQWQFTSQEGKFDYFPAGDYEVLSSSAHPMRASVVRIPVGFERSVWQERGTAEYRSPRLQFSDRRLSAIVHFLADAFARLAIPYPADAVLLSVALVDRLEDLAVPARARSAKFSRVLAKVIAECIEEHLDEPLPLSRLAMLVGLARTQFGQMFKLSFGAPLHQYTLSRKIEVARSRLKFDSLAVGDLAHELGFSSHSHFTTVFRLWTGTTPSQYRLLSEVHTGEAQ
jgi:AraC-like DNA-binding protein